MQQNNMGQNTGPLDGKLVAQVLLYVEDLWPRLVHRQERNQGTLIGLPHPYVTPTDEPMFHREMYYWDTFFMALGLNANRHRVMIPGLAKNLAVLFEKFQVIPNANRYYYLSRSQPPLLTRLVWLGHDVVMDQEGADSARRFLSRMMQTAREEHRKVLMGTHQPHHRLVHAGLSRYYDTNVLEDLASCESGWDHSTRCDGRWLEHLPVDLNSILFMRELDIAAAAELLGQPSRAGRWRAMAEGRRTAVSQLMWDESESFFFDYDFCKLRRTTHPSLAGFYPLWAKLASPAQAAKVVEKWLPRFECAGGVVTTLEARRGRQWAWPNGWAPLQWIITEGLDHYGYTREAMRIRQRWCSTCVAVFQKTGKMYEKYNVVNSQGSVEGGLYGQVTWFGWTNAVFSEFALRLGYNGKGK